jgi:hypothetical protein
MYNFYQIREALLNAKECPDDLLFGEKIARERIASIKQNSVFHPLLNEIRSEAERAVQSDPPILPFSKFHLAEVTGNRIEFQTLYFERRRRLQGLAMALFIDESDRYIQPLEDIIWEICNEYTWCLPAHLLGNLEACKSHFVPPEQLVDLFAAETAHMLAETWSLIGSKLNPWVEYRLRNEVERRVFQPYFHNVQRFFWESINNNWSAVCSGASGMAALILIGDRERLAGAIDRVLRAMEVFLSGYGEDGACVEGIGYWSFGFGYFVYFAEMLYAFTDGELDLLKGEKIRRIAGFPASVSLSEGKFVNFADSPKQNVLPAGLVCRLAQRLGSPVPEMKSVPPFNTNNSFRLANLTRNLFWTDGSLLGRKNREGTIHYPDTDWLIDRRYTKDKMLAFATKGGHNQEHHNHNDLGHFIIHIGGEDLLCDLGSGVYQKGYHGADRYRFIQCSSLGHSVPVINGKEQKPGSDHYATLLQCDSSEDGRVLYAMDLTRAYAVEEMKRFTREFCWEWNEPAGEAVLTLHDHFEFQECAVLEEVFVSLHKPMLQSGEAEWHGEHGKVVLTFNDAAAWDVQLEEIPEQGNDQERYTIYRLRLIKQNPKENEDVQFKFHCTLAK